VYYFCYLQCGQIYFVLADREIGSCDLADVVQVQFTGRYLSSDYLAADRVLLFVGFAVVVQLLRFVSDKGFYGLQGQ
jgi:hypothetical protein